MISTGRGRRRRVLLITALALVLVVGAAYAVFFSPLLVAEQVAVTGNRTWSELKVDEGRYDIGSKLDYLRATVELALAREDLGPEFRAWLSGYVREQQIG